MEPRIIHRDPFVVVGLHYRGNPQEGELPRLWQAFGPREHEIKGIVNDRVTYGLSANLDQNTGEFDYLAGLEAESGHALPEAMVAWEVPGGTYAVSTCTLATIVQTFDHAYGTWLPQSGYVRGDGPDLEAYQMFEGNDSDETFELYIPIRIAKAWENRKE